jgi:anti-sigma B factor antagonist
VGKETILMQITSNSRLLTSDHKGFTVVRLAGDNIELDEAKALWLREALGLLATQGRRRLAVDLGNVSFLTSTMVETLLALHRELTAHGGQLIVCNLSPAVREVFSVLRLADVLDVRAALD